MTDEIQTLIPTSTRCGMVAIIGRPNVGKSTLLNHILQQKISITSRKPQTTRHQITGIKTIDNAQIIFVDTPGQHAGGKKAINRYMNKVAVQTLTDVDLVVVLINRLKWTEEDEMVITRLKQAQQKLAKPLPVIIAINKVDKLDDKSLLLPHIKFIEAQLASTIVPVSALKGNNLDVLEQCIIEHLPESNFIYDKDDITNRSSKFLVAEIIREKIIRQLGDEVPYASTVEIEQYEIKGKTVHIAALIWVERDGQKPIIIGNKGARLKLIGSESRRDIELLIESKVMLKLWVKVKSNWSDDDRILLSLGYD